jgi:sugar (pentulose or hexulose) kinase
MAGSSSPQPLVAGVDLATADVRVAVADGEGRLVARAQAPLAPPDRPRPGLSEQDAGTWWPTASRALREALSGLGERVVAVAVSATSGTVVLGDDRGEPVGPAILYDDDRVPAPDRWDLLLDRPGAAAAAHAWHAPDLVVAHLTGEPPPTDWSHALKTGYDPGQGRWQGSGGAARTLRPEVLAPTSLAGTVCAGAAAATGLPETCEVRLGMTDACAAQLAAGADRPGRFVTVLGPTLAVKGASEDRLDEPGSGIYSHRHPDGWWLPGGASNVGGGSLTARFGVADLGDLDRRAAARGPATVACYPLVRRGERFPCASIEAEELWTGPPDGPVDAYRAVLEGVAFVERLGYERLAALGAAATPPLRTAGGGSRSRVWSTIRATVLGRPVVDCPSGADTAFGACILAAAGTLHPSLTAAGEAMVADPGHPVEPVAAERERLEDGCGRFLEAIRERGWLSWPG